MKPKISILGCGWLGLPLASKLASEGYVVYGSTTSISKLDKLKSEGITPYLIDISNLDNNISGFLNSEILIIAITSKNINDNKKLLQRIETSHIKKVIFVSSTSVYENSNQIVTEESSTKNTQLLHIEKLLIENKKIKTTIIRFGGLFGYNRKPSNFIPLNKKMENPEGFVNLIHRDDCIKIIEQLILKNVWDTILNACADSHPKRRDFYTKENLKLGNKNTQFNENSLNEYKIISSEKLKSTLDYNFEYSDLMLY
ncbi:NAD(P)H-binding protein [uncultured Lutibacter sp.]|uniref:NAD(P)H-binding protein n=1 Tax=uncultured Lutibacter sp. TaxID=437739 RepID=UPI00263289D9|nr:NAD(P)H-binding protein [uncultured Lutibacter sp.]